MNVIILATGHAHLGRNTVDKDGNVIESTPAHFEFAPDGPCVAVGELDPVTMVVKDGASIYGDWDAAGYLKEAMEKLKPTRTVNIPDFKAMYQAAYKDRWDLCDHCQSLNLRCQDCIVREWKEEVE